MSLYFCMLDSSFCVFFSVLVFLVFSVSSVPCSSF